MRKLPVAALSALVCAMLLSGCGAFSGDVPRFGIGGHYNAGKAEFQKGRGGNMDKAIIALDSVVRDDPTYKDSLTLLGRAYYNKGNYEIAKQILQRAVLVKKDDEIAWAALGMTQLRLGEDDKGIETLRGAITLLSKVSRSGYRDFPEWDSKGLVRSYISRSVVDVQKGVDGKTSVIRDCEVLLTRIDEEESYQKQTTLMHRNRDD